MASKKEKETKKIIEDTLKHEENLRHDQNEESITFAKKAVNRKLK